MGHHVEDRNIDGRDFTNVAQINDFIGLIGFGFSFQIEFARFDEAGVFAGQTDRFAAGLVNQANDRFVDLPA